MNELNGSHIEPKGPQPQSIIDLFLCHNGADKEWVEKLAEQIESETFEGTPNGRALRVFFDKWDIRPGANVIQRLNDGLAKARYVAVVVSPDMVAADWPTLEWTHVIADGALAPRPGGTAADAPGGDPGAAGARVRPLQ